MFKQVELLPPPGMKNCTAPTVHAPGQALLLPVVVSTQWFSLARSPCGGVPAGGSAFGSPVANGMPSPSGGDGCGPAAQLEIVTDELPPVFSQKVNPVQLPLEA